LNPKYVTSACEGDWKPHFTIQSQQHGMAQLRFATCTSY
jgi:hypothetical protein